MTNANRITHDYDKLLQIAIDPMARGKRFL